MLGEDMNLWPWSRCAHRWVEKERIWKVCMYVDGWTGKEMDTAPKKYLVIVLRCTKCGELKNHNVGD